MLTKNFVNLTHKQLPVADLFYLGLFALSSCSQLPGTKLQLTTSSCNWLPCQICKHFIFHISGECDEEIEFSCTSGGCINATWYCDGEEDCFDGSDEVNCTCAEDEYTCEDGLQCIPEEYECDYIIDCYDYSDETANCTCDLEYEFECESGGCINGTWVCDGEEDCVDGSDEAMCTTEEPGTEGRT